MVVFATLSSEILTCLKVKLKLIELARDELTSEYFKTGEIKTQSKNARIYFYS
jgi:hypothetical protein